ncbi:MAG: delta-60 repeat domain-containing protein, partial [Anaerolineales bacterium]|nr:delta-60 repeat domain-containing protein [Anaerolineales bacterium]
MKIRRIFIGLLFMALIPAASVQADLNPGSLDTGFDPAGGASSYVLAVALQTDGKVLIGGAFDKVDGVERLRIARLNA